MSAISLSIPYSHILLTSLLLTLTRWLTATQVPGPAAASATYHILALLKQLCAQMNFRSGQRLRHRTVLFGVKRILLKCRVINSGHIGFSLKLNLGDGKRLSHLFQFHSCFGVDAFRRESCTRELCG